MHAAPYRIPAGPHRGEQVVQRSRFIASIGHAATPDDARAFIDGIRDEFADATHNCWAYVAGPPGATAAVGFSDAGEPHGSAGRPMLDVLLHSGVGEIVAVVTRYYGGVKLGRGGLVRAYGGAVQHALAALPVLEKIERVDLVIEIGYADVEAVRRTLGDAGAEIARDTYGEQVRYEAAVPASAEARLRRDLADRTAGRCRVHTADSRDVKGPT